MIEDIRQIEQAEAQADLLQQQIANSKAALAAKIGEGNGAMKEHGSPEVMAVIDGRLRVIPVTYLHQPAAAQPAAPVAAPMAAPGATVVIP